MSNGASFARAALSREIASLVATYPGERIAIERLDKLILEGGDSEYTLGALEEILQPPSPYLMPTLLLPLIRAGLLGKVVRVMSSSGAVLLECSSLLEVPERVYDGDLGGEIVVLPEMLVTVLRVGQALQEMPLTTPNTRINE